MGEPWTILGWVIIVLLVLYAAFLGLGVVLLVRERRRAWRQAQQRRARMDRPLNPGRRAG